MGAPPRSAGLVGPRRTCFLPRDGVNKRLRPELPIFRRLLYSAAWLSAAARLGGGVASHALTTLRWIGGRGGALPRGPLGRQGTGAAEGRADFSACDFLLTGRLFALLQGGG